MNGPYAIKPGPGSPRHVWAFSTGDDCTPPQFFGRVSFKWAAKHGLRYLPLHGAGFFWTWSRSTARFAYLRIQADHRAALEQRQRRNGCSLARKPPRSTACGCQECLRRGWVAA